MPVAPAPLQHRSPGEGPPPAGAPWDLPVAEAPFAFLDLEMTGLRLGHDRVLEICIERVRGTIVEDRIETVIDPGEVRGGETIHGIGDAAIAGAPGFGAVADQVVAILRGAVVVAHGAVWDLLFLRDELARVGREAEAPTHAIDTVVLARRALHFHAYGLQALAASLGLPAGPAHRAGGDVATMRALWSKLVAELSPKTARDLWEVRIGERAPRPEIVAEIEAAIARGASVTVVYRPAHRGPQTLEFVATALDGTVATDAKHVDGYVLPGRGRRSLRLDRILRVERR